MNVRNLEVFTVDQFPDNEAVAAAISHYGRENNLTPDKLSTIFCRGIAVSNVPGIDIKSLLEA
jgi:hypothetical protein